MRYKRRIFTDKLQAEAKEYNGMCESIVMGEDNIEAVDMNGAFVAIDKTKSEDNLKRTNENINWRFQTEPVNDFDEEVTRKK
ncbi:MAG: hypothetical protein PHE73_08835 [Sulfurovaceae bacterium]|nr:hypothetical protein [Sulfurovaceae bacterium]